MFQMKNIIFPLKFILYKMFKTYNYNLFLVKFDVEINCRFIFTTYIIFK
jgi:hypothetical protein